MNKADKQYQALLSNIIENGRQKGDRTGTGTISIPFGVLDFNMSEGFPLLTTKKVFTKAIVHELLWFLKGDTNVKGLEQHNVSIWTSDAYREYTKEWMKQNPPMSGPYTDKMMTKEEFTESVKIGKGWDLGPVYGAQWRRWKSYDKHKQSPDEFEDVIYIDQIQQVMDKLINNPDDRRIMVSAWNVAEIDKMALPPCHYGFQLYSEELTMDERLKLGWKTGDDFKKSWSAESAMLHYPDGHYEVLDKFNIPKRSLSLIWDQRSCDTFLGIPFNIASYGILLHMFAQQANMVPDRLIGSLKNVHVYNNHIDQCKEQIAREPRKLPRIVLNKAKDIFSYTYDDIKIVDYNPHDKIAGAISV
jgi:thymidylate synthase